MTKQHVTSGQKVRFDPFETAFGFGVDAIRGEVTGTVVAVYKDHKWFSVEYGNPKQRISFKFGDVGERVMLGG